MMVNSILESEHLTVRNLDAVQWMDLVNVHEWLTYQHLPAYAEAAAARVKSIAQYLAIYDGDKLIGLCNIRVKKIPFVSMRLAYINGSPLLVNNDENDVYGVLDKVLIALMNEYVKKGGCVLKIIGCARFNIDKEIVDKIYKKNWYDLDEGGGYKTIIVNISGSSDEIKSRLNQMWRRNLKKAEKLGVEVVKGYGADYFDEYIKLHRCMIGRKGIDIKMGPEFFAAIQEKLESEHKLVVHLAKYKGEIVAGHVAGVHGDTAIYILGATNDKALECYASNILHWNVIQYAKDSGCAWYDLAGIDPIKNPGGYNFKSRMGGAEYNAPGPYWAGSKLKLFVLKRLEIMYRRYRG